MMAMRTSPRLPDDAQLRAETEQRRAAFQARLERDRRLLVGIAGLVAVIGTAAMIGVTGLFAG